VTKAPKTGTCCIKLCGNWNCVASFPLVWFFSVVNNLIRSPPAGEFDAPEVFATVGE
jgi:hypothetical protein